MSITNEQSNAMASGLETTSDLSSYVRQFTEEVAALPTYRPVIGAVIPAYNEAESIEAVLRSLLKQTRLPDEIHVIVNNTKDDTFELAAKFAGPRKEARRRQGRDAPDAPRSSCTTSARTRTRRSAPSTTASP